MKKISPVQNYISFLFNQTKNYDYLESYVI